jgi:transcriptional regulator with XRE-family HTH domain
MDTNKTTSVKPPHMGSFIKAKIEEQQLSYAEVCRRMNIKQPTMNGYFIQDTLQLKTLWKLCHALQYNLFSDLIRLLPETLQNTNKTSFQETISAQQQQIEDLKKEIAIYKDILKSKS